MISINLIETKNIVTKTSVPAGDYVINPYIGCPHKCIYCYADFMRRFTNHEEKWGDFLDVKIYNKRIRLNTLKGKKIVFSTVTDAYNQLERKYRITRKLREFYKGIGIYKPMEVLELYENDSGLYK